MIRVTTPGTTTSAAAQQDPPPELREVRPGPRGRWIALAVALLVTALAALALPHPPRTSGDRTGDPGLAARLGAAAAGVPGQGFAAATGGAGEPVRTAAVGRADARPGSERAMTAATPQEIGSVTKSMTGLLFADAVARGEVEPTTTLGEVFPGAGLPDDVAGLTLEQLATHTSGLPSLGDGRLVRGLVTNYTHGNPYADQSVDDVLTEAAGTRRREAPGEYAYSNLGFSLLGHALAARAGTTWPDLLQRRLLDPLGMSTTAVGAAPDGAGVWSSAQDLGRLLQAVADGSAPGLDALAPRTEGGQDDVRTGYGWFTLDRDGREVLFNNGATGGGVSSVVLDPATGAWVAVTAPSSTQSQTVAFRLAGLNVTAETAWERWTAPTVLVTGVLVLVVLAGTVPAAVRRRVRRPEQRLDRLQVVSAHVVPAVVLLVGLRAVGAWQVVPPVVWLLTVLVAALACTSLLVRWPRLAWPGTRRAVRWTGAGVGTAAYLAVLVLLVGDVV